MPSEIPNWLAEEVPQSFLAGKVFVAPAELVGINPLRPMRGVEDLAEIACGVPTSQSIDASVAILDLDIPLIEGMSPGDFEGLLADHQDDLTEFQTAFRSLMSGYDGSLEGRKAASERFRSAVDELHRSRKLEQFRRVVEKCRGSLTSFPIAMGVLAAAGAVYAKDPFAGAAVMGAAGKALRDLWTEARDKAEVATRSPFRFLFRPGVEKVRFRSSQKPARIKRIRLPELSELSEITLGHWLCPPSGAGLRFLMLKEE